jgi:5-methylthioadenosine/S-adenosylhomocysteine deaminase
VGLVWDHYYHGRAVAEALVDTGLSGVVAPTLQDLAGPGRNGFEKALAETAWLAQQSELRAKGVFTAVGPHATDTVSAELMGKALSLAQTHQLPLHLHLAQSIEELRRVTEREGCSPMSWLDRQGVLDGTVSLVLAHALYASADDLSLLDPSRHLLALCPFSQLNFGFTAPVFAWCELGMSWAVATDCAAGNDSMNLQKELRLAAALPKAGITSTQSYRDFFQHGELSRAELVQRERDEAHTRFAAHASPSALLERVWELPGEAHRGFRVGAIEVGCLANLLAWDTDHPAFWPEGDLVRALAYGDTTQAIHAMFVCGKRIGKIGDFQASLLSSPEYREARLEATERLEHLIRCAG